MLPLLKLTAEYIFNSHELQQSQKGASWIKFVSIKNDPYILDISQYLKKK